MSIINPPFPLYTSLLVWRRNKTQRKRHTHAQCTSITWPPQCKEIINVIHIADRSVLSYKRHKKVKYNNCWCTRWDAQLIFARLLVLRNHYWHCYEIDNPIMGKIRFHNHTLIPVWCPTFRLKYKDTNA